jgi:hypothetical protein
MISFLNDFIILCFWDGSVIHEYEEDIVFGIN